MSIDQIDGVLPIAVPEQRKLTKAQRFMLRVAYNDGRDLPAKVRYNCHIANSVNAFIADGFTVGDRVFMPNPNVTAQFGKDKDNRPYLTVGLRDHGITGDNKEGEPITLTWRGDAVPLSMVKVAVKHDEGKNHAAVTINLDMSKAIVRKTPKHDKRQRHDIHNSGQQYLRPHRPHHNRLCSDDIRRIAETRST